MNNQYLSVIVPVYNAENTLRECVESILTQKFKDFELILIDDGSIDRSPSICDEYAKKDSRVHVFHKHNEGVSSARNFGLENSTGEWITFIDSDDYISDSFFDNIIVNDDDIIIRGYNKFNNAGIVEKKEASFFLHADNLASLIHLYFNDTILRGPVSKFYKRSLLADLSFNTEMKIGEDACFLFKYLSNCKSFCVLDGGEYYIRMSDESYDVRYAMTVDYATKSLSYLKDAFDCLQKTHDIDKSLFFSYISFFKLMSEADWKDNPKLWFSNSIIKSIINDIWPSLTGMQKIRYGLSRLHSYYFR